MYPDNVVVMGDYVEFLYGTDDERGTATAPLTLELELKKASELQCPIEVSEYSRKGSHLQLSRRTQVKLLTADEAPFNRPEFHTPQSIDQIQTCLVGTIIPSIKVKVFSAQPSHEVIFKNRTPTPVQLTAIADSTGITTINIWGSKLQSITIGSSYEMRKCRIKEYNNNIILTSTKASSFTKIPDLPDIVDVSKFRFDPTNNTGPTTIAGIRKITRRALCTICKTEIMIQGKAIVTCQGCKMTILAKNCNNIRVVEAVTSGGQNLIFKDNSLNSYSNGEFLDGDEELMVAMLSGGEQEYEYDKDTNIVI